MKRSTSKPISIDQSNITYASFNKCYSDLFISWIDKNLLENWCYHEILDNNEDISFVWSKTFAAAKSSQ